PAALKAGLLLDLAEDLGLSDEQTLTLLRAFRTHEEQRMELREQQAALRAELKDYTGEELPERLEDLMRVDARLHALESDFARSQGEGLAPAQRVRLYLLLSTLEEHSRALLR